ncbi:MAG TPA: FkbM family methyltransferase [Methylovirgula sp.]|nr:FkbM family methyltransferase [Methylovirgula sp.]
MTSKRLLNRAAIRLWRTALPRFAVYAGGRRIFVSANVTKPSALLNWKYDWKTEVIRRVLKIARGDFIDIGANVGQTLLDYIAAGGNERYIGFEPNPHSFASLFSLADENRLGGCVVLPVGLSDKTRLLTLYAQRGVPTDNGASLIADLRPGIELEDNVVPCYRFDDIRDDLGLDAIGLVKVDVEGAELQVLQGMHQSLKDFRPPLLCEILGADAQADIAKYEATLEALTDFLHAHDYTVFNVQKDRLELLFLGLVKTAKFPVRVWTQENAHECDYLIIPSERISDYEVLIRN